MVICVQLRIQYSPVPDPIVFITIMHKLKIDRVSINIEIIYEQYINHRNSNERMSSKHKPKGSKNRNQWLILTE